VRKTVRTTLRMAKAARRPTPPRLDVVVHLAPDLLTGIVEPLQQLLKLTRAIHAQGARLMADLRELQSELTEIKAGIVDLKTRAAATIQAQVDEIARLTAIIAAGGAITQADLDGLDAQADDALALLAPDAPPA